MERFFGKLSLSFLVIFFLAFNTQAAGVVGKVTILKGQVFIKRGAVRLQVKKDDTILESDIIESEAGTARITMIDSNLVDVYPRSKVEIAKYVYKPNENQKDVELKVDFGKIKSTVNQKYDGANNKFQVKTPSAVAGVRGTVFTAEYDAVRKISKVVTIEGLVAVTKMIDRERQSPPVFVRPDQVVKVDVEQSKAEQPRDLKPEEKETSQKEDKDLGYQYDPKKDPATEVPATGAVKEQVKEIKESAREQIKEIKESAKEAAAADPGIDNATNRQAVKEQIKEVKESARDQIKEVRQPRETVVKEVPVKEVPPKEVAVREPDKRIKEPVKQIKETLTNAVNNMASRQQQQQQEQERRQKESEDEQGKRQKQLEDEQAKKQKQMEEEQGKKQKQLEEEQSKKQKQLDEEQARKQKHMEEEQVRKQKEMEEALRKKQQANENAQRRAEMAKRLSEIAKRAEGSIGLPSGTQPLPTMPGTTITPTK